MSHIFFWYIFYFHLFSYSKMGSLVCTFMYFSSKKWSRCRSSTTRRCHCRGRFRQGTSTTCLSSQAAGRRTLPTPSPWPLRATSSPSTLLPSHNHTSCFAIMSRRLSLPLGILLLLPSTYTSCFELGQPLVRSCLFWVID